VVEAAVIGAVWAALFLRRRVGGGGGGGRTG
jgi:hypothetical protein